MANANAADQPWEGGLDPQWQQMLTYVQQAAG